MSQKERVALSGMANLAAAESIEGTWQLSNISPATARREWEFHTLLFRDNGAYYSESRGPLGLQTCSGTYVCEDDQLFLRAHSGERHTFTLRLVSEQQLELCGNWNGEVLVAEFRREPVESEK